MFTKRNPRKGGRAGQCGLALLLCLSLFLGALPGRAWAQDPFQAMIEHDFAFAAQQLDRSIAISKTRYPSTTKPDGTWNTTSASSWRRVSRRMKACSLGHHQPRKKCRSAGSPATRSESRRRFPAWWRVRVLRLVP